MLPDSTSCFRFAQDVQLDLCHDGSKLVENSVMVIDRIIWGGNQILDLKLHLIWILKCRKIKLILRSIHFPKTRWKLKSIAKKMGTQHSLLHCSYWRGYLAGYQTTYIPESCCRVQTKYICRHKWSCKTTGSLESNRCLQFSENESIFSYQKWLAYWRFLGNMKDN